MFIEKLRKNDYENFVKQYGFELDKILYTSNKQLRLDIKNKDIYFYVTDFSCKVANYYKEYPENIEKNWFRFLYNTFGNDFLNAYREDFITKHNEIIKEITK